MPTDASPLLIADSPPITARAEKDGKIRLTSASWDSAKVIHDDEVLELRWEANGVHLVRRPQHGPRAGSPQGRWGDEFGPLCA